MKMNTTALREAYRHRLYPIHRYDITIAGLRYGCTLSTEWEEYEISIFDTDEDSAIETITKEYGQFFGHMAIINVERIDY